MMMLTGAWRGSLFEYFCERAVVSVRLKCRATFIVVNLICQQVVIKTGEHVNGDNG